MERVSKYRVGDDWINCEIAYLKKRMKFDGSDAVLTTETSVPILFAMLEEIKERRKKESEVMQEREKAINKFWERIAISYWDRPCSMCPAAVGGKCGAFDRTCGRSLRKKYESIAGGPNGRAEKPVLPIPCTKGFEDWNVKDYFQKINEELDELKAEVLNAFYSLEVVPPDRPDLRNAEHDRMPKIAEEAADAITAIASMLEAMGIDEQQRQAAQRRVNEHNRERGRL